MAPRIAVYGSSLVSERDPGYRLAYDLGAELARQGATVVTGGYGGVMEAASRGAAEAAGTWSGSRSSSRPTAVPATAGSPSASTPKTSWNV